MSETSTEAATDGQQTASETSFSQADVDRIVADRLKREREATKAKYADYDDLKTKAAGTKTAEDRIKELEKTAAAAAALALRADIANQYGISTEDRELFLTGTDKDTLTAQAERLADRAATAKKTGNYSPREGHSKTSGGSDQMRSFTRSLFAND